MLTSNGGDTKACGTTGRGAKMQKCKNAKNEKMLNAKKKKEKKMQS